MTSPATVAVRTLVATLLLAVVLPAPPATAQAPRDRSADPGASVIFLVRHAEKEPEGTDPPLTPAGRERAEALAHLLKDAEIDRIHSTSTRRTLGTAEPLSRTRGVPIEPYDGGALETIAARLRDEPGRHLVVGHSNTTPELVARLGGVPGKPIAEAWEYDRLYVVTLEPGGGVGTLLLRYGEPAEP